MRSPPVFAVVGIGADVEGSVDLIETFEEEIGNEELAEICGWD